MRSSICDDAARTFAIGRYGGIGERESVSAAFRQGCAAIRLAGFSDRNEPRLRVHDGVNAELLVVAEWGSGDSAAPSRRSAPPIPAYADAEVQALSEQLERAHKRKQNLRDARLA